MPVIPVIRRLREKNGFKSEHSLSFIMRTCLKNMPFLQILDLPDLRLMRRCIFMQLDRRTDGQSSVWSNSMDEVLTVNDVRPSTHHTDYVLGPKGLDWFQG